MNNEAKKKWIYEIIVDKVPLFSIIPKRFRVLFQLTIMETVGLSIAYYEGLEVRSIILGSLAILAVAIWSQIAIYIGPAVRGLRNPSSPQELNIMESYRQYLFGEKRYELIIGVFIFSLMLAYFIFSPKKPLMILLSKTPSLTIVFFVSILLWDLTYRIGLSLWASVASLNCSMRLFFASKTRFKLGYTSYKELNSLKFLSVINLSFLIGFMPLIPLSIKDSFLISFATMYMTIIIFSSILSWKFLDRIPLYPPEVLWLFEEAMYAYIGTSNKNRMPHVTPVIFVFDGKEVYMATSKISRKVANLKENNDVALLIDIRDPVNLLNNRAVMIKGKAKIFNPFDAIIRFWILIKIRRLFHHKYPHYMRKYVEERDNIPLAWQTTLFVSRLLIRIRMEEFIYWKEAKRIHITI